MYYRGAQAAVVVYDITNSDSFQRAKFWVKELQRQTTSNTIIALAGNKLDLAPERRQVSTEEARTYAEDNGLLFMETSAKTAVNTNEVFTVLAERVLAYVEPPPVRTSSPHNEGKIKLVASSEQLNKNSKNKNNCACN